VYIPQISSTNWQLSTTLATVKKRWTALGMPLAGRPWAVGELGVQADTITPDLSRGPAAMSRAYTTALANGFVGISWWTIGGDSFCHGSVPPVTRAATGSWNWPSSTPTRVPLTHDGPVGGPRMATPRPAGFAICRTARCRPATGARR
jgi:hypothetical protein